MSEGGRGDPQIVGRPTTGCGPELAVAGGDRPIYGQDGRLAENGGQAPQPGGANGRVTRQQHAGFQLPDRYDADRPFLVEAFAQTVVPTDENAGVDDCRS